MTDKIKKKAAQKTQKRRSIFTDILLIFMSFLSFGISCSSCLVLGFAFSILMLNQNLYGCVHKSIRKRFYHTSMLAHNFLQDEVWKKFEFDTPGLECRFTLRMTILVVFTRSNLIVPLETVWLTLDAKHLTNFKYSRNVNY